jgi:hypothetical protein
MCRNIKLLFNFAPPTTDDEMRAAALQFVRKVSGMQKPPARNQAAFDAAVVEVYASVQKLLATLVTDAPPRTREEEALKGKLRFEKRMQRAKSA